ncbi:MAG TPA: folylpolyglutamate synthase/dihydrofolate synthase family protein, partial [Ginsengibacter sp.]|nr:folylpolyglutamate synthase/dihydrofolate synthase family protein [Ginsengibacter sp.]
NGKGSTSHMLASVIQQNGYKTGLYTSPHLKDFRERIKLNGEMIPKDFVIDFIKKIKTFSEEINPSFFELTFVMALEYFAQQKVDIAIIETGLGGRLDSTNVITPELAIITNIGFDHMDILGDTIAKIAGEKAGIIKHDVPVVIGETTPETKSIFQQAAKEKNAPIFYAEENYKIIHSGADGEKLVAQIFDINKKTETKYSLDLIGLYQLKNLLTVLTTIDRLKNKFLLKEESIKKGLSHVKDISGLHGRWEIIHRKPLIVLDVAHNVDGIRQLVNQINNSLFQKLHIVFGMVKDKEIEKVLELLPKNATYYFTKAQIPRALPENDLLERAQKFNLKGCSCDEVNKALKAAMDKAYEEDMIIVCGSVFVVGEVNLIV